MTSVVPLPAPEPTPASGVDAATAEAEAASSALGAIPAMSSQNDGNSVFSHPLTVVMLAYVSPLHS